jgi:hypothetical protein
MTRKLIWPMAKLRFAAASSSQATGAAGRLMMTPATMASTPLSASSPQNTARCPGSRK